LCLARLDSIGECHFYVFPLALAVLAGALWCLVDDESGLMFHVGKKKALKKAP